MRVVRRLSALLVLIALLAAVLPAVYGDDGPKVEVTGIVLVVNPADGSFQFREFSSNAVWSAFLQRDATVKGRGGDEDERRHRLTAGDIVEVEGRLLAGRTVLAKEIKVLGHAAVEPAPAQPAPQGTAPAPGVTVSAVVKTIGVGAAVKAFAPALNAFINRLLQAKDAETQQTTKVVPILSISIGINTPGRAAIGAAQVSGARAAVDKVQAVAALDASYQGTFSVRALVPVDSLEPWKHVRRVPGVGVSAIIDLKL